MKKYKKISLRKKVISNLQSAKIKGGTLTTKPVTFGCTNLPTGACGG